MISCGTMDGVDIDDGAEVGGEGSDPCQGCFVFVTSGW